MVAVSVQKKNKKIRESRRVDGRTLVVDPVYSFSRVFVFDFSLLLSSSPVAVCPNEAPGLAETHSAEFEALYLKYEATPGKARRVLKAREVWKAILDAQTETGTPYMLFKDASVTNAHARDTLEAGWVSDGVAAPAATSWLIFSLLWSFLFTVSHVLLSCNSKSNQQNLGVS